MSSGRQHWDYLDKIFFENYKKEIDQEENVWRTLPFFPATIAFELAALFQLRDQLFSLRRPLSIVATVGAVLFSASVITTLCYIWGSIRPRQLFYIAKEIDILKFAQEIEADSVQSGRTAADIQMILQDHVLEQWAIGASKNREVNQRRAQLRGRGARTLLISIFIVLTLIALAVVGHFGGQPAEHPHAENSRTLSYPSDDPTSGFASGTAGIWSRRTCVRIFPGIPENASCDDGLDLQRGKSDPPRGRGARS